MNEKQKRLNSIVDNAIKKFNNEEQHLMQNNLSERCVCSQFARYLEREIENTEFGDYKVDVEYNRGMYGKPFATKVINGHNSVVDLIVHKRGFDEVYGFNNLICVEMKKRGSREDLILKDTQRLEYLTHSEFNYRIGFFILIDKNGLSIERVFCNYCDF